MRRTDKIKLNIWIFTYNIRSLSNRGGSQTELWTTELRTTQLCTTQLRKTQLRIAFWLSPAETCRPGDNKAFFSFGDGSHSRKPDTKIRRPLTPGVQYSFSYCYMRWTIYELSLLPMSWFLCFYIYRPALFCHHPLFNVDSPRNFPSKFFTSVGTTVQKFRT